MHHFGKKIYIILGLFILIFSHVALGFMDHLKDRNEIFFEGILARFI